MPNECDTAAIAQALLSARAQRRQLQVTDIDGEVQTLADAYAVHEQVMQELGPVGAFKTSKLPDGTQIVAPIPASVVRPSGATFAADELLQVGIELEIAFRIERGLPSPDAEDFENKLRSCVVALPVIEVVDTRLAFLETCHPMMKLADNQSNGGLAIGQPVADWQERNVATPDHHFAAGDTVISTGAGAVPGGSAWDIFEGLVRVIGEHCGGLQVGQYVTTGALSGLHWIDKGCKVTGRIEGFGSVDVTIAA